MEYRLATMRLAEAEGSTSSVTENIIGRITFYTKDTPKEDKRYHLCWTIEVTSMYVGLWYFINGKAIQAKKTVEESGFLILASTNKTLGIPSINRKHIDLYVLHQKLEFLVGHVEGILKPGKDVPDNIYATYITKFGFWEGYRIDNRGTGNGSLKVFPIKTSFKPEEVRETIRKALYLGALLGNKLTKEVEDSFIKNNIYLD